MINVGTAMWPRRASAGDSYARSRCALSRRLFGFAASSARSRARAPAGVTGGYARRRSGRVMGLLGWSRSYIVGIPEACRPGSSQGNQIARTPIAARTTPVTWPNGLP